MSRNAALVLMGLALILVACVATVAVRLRKLNAEAEQRAADALQQMRRLSRQHRERDEATNLAMDRSDGI